MDNQLLTELKQRPQWVCWRTEDRNNKLTKVPYVPGTWSKAKANDPSTWRTYETANAERYRYGPRGGIGYFFNKEDGFVGLDLDKCFSDDKLSPWAEDIVSRTESYIEYSVSNNGLHIIIKAELKLDGGRARKLGGGAKLEVYESLRYFVVTEQPFYPDEHRTVINDQALANFVIKKYFPVVEKETPLFEGPSITDKELLDKLSKDNNAFAWKRLYVEGDVTSYDNDRSDADWALVKMMLRYTTDRVQIERIWKGSALKRDKLNRQDYIERTISKAILSKQQPKSPGGTWALTDMGNAERLVYSYGKDLKHCDGLNSWLAWDGRRWLKRSNRIAKVWCDRTVRNIQAEALHCGEDEVLLKAILRWAKFSEGSYKRKNMLTSAENILQVMTSVDELDQDPYLFNLKNGTINLRTGDIRPPLRSDFCTKLSPVDYNPEAKCPQFLRFLEEIIPSEEIRRYLQRALGYSMIGKNLEDVWWLLYGAGANGKSTLVNTILYVMGDYGQMLPHCLLLGKKLSKTNPEVLNVHGVRFGATVESLKGQDLAVRSVKALTGGDAITAYAKYSNEGVTVIPQLKIWLATNHEPRIKDATEGMWRRIRKIPFNVYIPEERRDKTLRERLGREEGSGIFNWLLRGCMDWGKDGLQDPPEVRLATETYRREQDPMTSFIEECLAEAPGQRLDGKVIYLAYVAWCGKEGEYRETRKALYNRIQRDFRKIEDSRVVRFDRVVLQGSF